MSPALAETSDTMRPELAAYVPADASWSLCETYDGVDLGEHFGTIYLDAARFLAYACIER